MFRRLRGTPSHPPTPEAAARIAEHLRVVCHSVWPWRARCISITIGERRGGGRLKKQRGPGYISILTAEFAEEHREMKKCSANLGVLYGFKYFIDFIF